MLDLDLVAHPVLNSYAFFVFDVFLPFHPLFPHKFQYVPPLFGFIIRVGHVSFFEGRGLYDLGFQFFIGQRKDVFGVLVFWESLGINNDRLVDLRNGLCGADCGFIHGQSTNMIVPFLLLFLFKVNILMLVSSIIDCQYDFVSLFSCLSIFKNLRVLDRFRLDNWIRFGNKKRIKFAFKGDII